MDVPHIRYLLKSDKSNAIGMGPSLLQKFGCYNDCRLSPSDICYL